MPDSQDASTDFRHRLILIIIVGLLLQGWLWYRQGITADQNAVLYYGAVFAQDGTLPAYAKPSSAGAHVPGFLLPGSVWLALEVWPDYRSPGLFLLLSHLASCVLITSIIRRCMDQRGALLYAALYWLSAWRLFYGASIWEPAFLFLPAAIHMWLCYRLREQRSAVASGALAALLVLTFQFHATAVMLVAATAYLMVRRVCRIHLAGFAVGGALAMTAYIPTWLDPGDLSAWPQSHQGILAGLLSMLKGATLWLRLPTPDLFERIIQTGAWGEGVSALLSVLVALALAIVLVSTRASWSLLRRRPKADPSSPSGWLNQYALGCLFAVLAAALVSPATIQPWHVVIVLHAAVIPVITWLYRPDRMFAPKHRRLVLGWLGLSLATVIVLGLSHPLYQRPSSASLDELNSPPEVRVLVPHSR